MNYKKLGQRIREKRIEQNMTQEMLAEKTNFSIVHISHIETGYTKPSIEALISICNALSITPDFVLFDSLHVSKEYIKDEIASLLKQCSDKEIKLIAEIIKSIVNSKDFI